MTSGRDTHPHCAGGRHGLCPGDRETCACEACHLGPCARCGAGNLQKLYDGLCAGCYRADAHAANTPTPRSPCDRCGHVPAFRNLAHRRNELLCARCHEADGVPLRLRRGDAAALLAPCAFLDLDDPAHRWAHLRGTRFGCAGCGAKRFDPERRRAMREAAVQ